MADEKEKAVKPINVLTPDEAKFAAYVRVRTEKTLGDIRALAEEGNKDPEEWCRCFSYLGRTYGRDSDETFKWYKYYYRNGMIPKEVALDVLIQVYLTCSVDQGFANMLVKAVREMPEETRAQREKEMTDDLVGKYMEDDGTVKVYRGCFERPFGTEDDRTRPIEKACAFSLDKNTAKKYATMWFPEKAWIYEGRVKLSDIAYCSVYDEEKTIILIPQFKGGQWTIENTEEVPESEYGSEDEKKEARADYVAAFKH